MASKKSKQKKPPSQRLTIMQVAMKISRSYQATRTMMMNKKFGPTQYDSHTRRLTCTPEGLAAYLQSQKNTDDSKDAA